MYQVAPYPKTLRTRFGPKDHLSKGVWAVLGIWVRDVPGFGEARSQSSACSSTQKGLLRDLQDVSSDYLFPWQSLYQWND